MDIIKVVRFKVDGRLCIIKEFPCCFYDKNDIEIKSYLCGYVEVKKNEKIPPYAIIESAIEEEITFENKLTQSDTNRENDTSIYLGIDFAHLSHIRLNICNDFDLVKIKVNRMAEVIDKYQDRGE